MSSNSVRTIVTFGIIALALGAVVVGAVRFTKVRSNSYATSPHTSKNVAQTNTQKQPASQPQPQKDTSKSTAPSTPAQNASNQPNPTPSQSQTSTPATSSTPPAPDKSVVAAAPQQGKLPQTSAMSPGDVGFTMVLMMLAAFFGNRLLRARADYRRYIGS